MDVDLLDMESCTASIDAGGKPGKHMSDGHGLEKVNQRNQQNDRDIALGLCRQSHC